MQLTRGRKKLTYADLFFESSTKKTTATKQTEKKTPKSRNVETYIAKLLSNRI